MSMMKPTYHLPPNFSTPPPPAGPFHLGTVIRSFECREQMRPLNQSAESRQPVGEDEIYRDHKGGFEVTRAKLKSGALGLWAQFLGVDGVGAEVSISAEKEDSDVYKFDSVDTEYFFPSPRYISSCIENPDVDDYLKGYNYTKPVYLVTGLKVAKGVSVRLEKGGKMLGKAEVGLNNPGGSNISVGPRVEGSAKNSSVLAFSESSDLVVGIQCLKLYYKSPWFGGEKQLKEELYTKGATFVDDEQNEQDDHPQTDNYIIADSQDSGPPGSVCRSQSTGEDSTMETWVL